MFRSHASEAKWQDSASPNHDDQWSGYSYEDIAEDDYEVVDYRASEASGPSSPGPDQPPRLPSPSNESYQSEGAGNPRQLVESPRKSREENLETRNVPPMSRHALAQRLARIARQLATTTEDELPFDPLSLTEQVNQIELNLLGISPATPLHGASQLQSQSSPASLSITIPLRIRPAFKGKRTQPSQEAVTETASQLSRDLETLHSNLRARHEEATHIHALLLSRLELAAQRILVLQRQAEELEGELRDSDDELGHLRVLLKALEIQVPDHPDEDLRRCLVRVREEFWAVRKRRQALRQNEVENEGG